MLLRMLACLPACLLACLLPCHFLLPACFFVRLPAFLHSASLSGLLHCLPMSSFPLLAVVLACFRLSLHARSSIYFLVWSLACLPACSLACLPACLLAASGEPFLQSAALLSCMSASHVARFLPRFPLVACWPACLAAALPRSLA